MCQMFKFLQGIRSFPRRIVISIIIFRVHRFLIKYNKWLISFLIGFLGGRLSNELSNPDITSFLELLDSMFSVRNRSLNWSTWLILAVIIILIVLSSIINYLRKKLRDEATLRSILKRLKDPLFSKYNEIGIDKALTLQRCPEPDRGWRLIETEKYLKVDLRHDTSQFNFPEGVRENYAEYRGKFYYEKKFMDDGILVMLLRNPRAFTDTPTLVLDTKEVLFSQVLFFRERILREAPNLLYRLIDDVMNLEDISFPHAISMHFVVVTQDEHVLITKRSPKTEWVKNLWSCSVEENFSQKDLGEGRRGVDALRHWVERALREELGLDKTSYAMENVRILSVFLESDIREDSNIFNISLCTLVTLDIDHHTLSDIIKFLPRRDFEFTDFEFLNYHEMAKEFVQPSRNYHPTSRYRMFLSLIHKYGEADFIRRFLAALRRN